MKDQQKIKGLAFILVGLFALTGTYNAFVINSESSLSGSEAKFVKRLDEVYGVTIYGREIASATWNKLSPTKNFLHKNSAIKVNTKAQVITSTSSENIFPVAAVQEELMLSLVEVINPTKWQNGLSTTQFNGYLSTHNGIIETLVVSLPNGDGVSISFAEMSGNVFEYDLNGEQFSGMMYQVDHNAYMITLTNGPLEGTRLRFSAVSSEISQNLTQERLAESNIEIGNFGIENSLEVMTQNGSSIEKEATLSPGFNLDQAEIL